MDRDKIIGILRDDLTRCLERIDFSGAYNPCGGDFLTALRIGQMMSVLSSPDDDVSGELSGAERYLAAYRETSDASFKEMAMDELRHAGILIKRYLSQAADEAVRMRMDGYERRRQELSRTVSSATVPLKD